MAKLKHLLPDKQLNESGLARLSKHMEEHDCGTITAFRSKEGCAGPEDKPYTRSDNQKRNRQLYANLQMMGYGVTAVHGAYIENYGTPDAKEVRENVYFVVDIKDKGKLREDLINLGGKYEQDSILFIPKGGEGSILIGTNSCPNSYPGFGKEQKFRDRKMGKGGEFMTKVSGRPFMFENNLLETVVEDNYFQHANIMGKWATKTIAKGDWKDIDI
jgi:hypothetical protein